jgi:hypothetical protein
MRLSQAISGRLANIAILIVLGINIIVGLLVFQDYGLSLDEPLYYAYGEAIGYAYNPAEWFSGDFVITRAFGPSPADHRNRGPAYLLLARIPARLFQIAGLDFSSSWHLVNFLLFQIGLYFFYFFCQRWMTTTAALGATLLLSTQPIVWEHAFINPKDMPFLVFFIITLYLGFRMADHLAAMTDPANAQRGFRIILIPAIMLGLTTNLRVLGPLAGLLTGLYFLTLRKPKTIIWFLPYGIIAYLTMVATWPYLWLNPIGKFIEVVQFMADNPTQLRVLFYGQLYPADNLPLRYLPAMMLFTLTEPVWLLTALGAGAASYRWLRHDIEWKALAIAMGWFVIPLIYVLLIRPPMYDGFRHFLFIIPPLFILTGIALDFCLNRLTEKWQQGLLIMIILVPGLSASIKLHPYQYTYYNTFIGGTGEAAYRFETDYWLTCYKEALEQLAPYADKPVNLYVQREYYIAQYYATDQIAVKDLLSKNKTIGPGDFILWSSRANPGLQRYRSPDQVVLRVEREGALFCVTQRQ